MSYIGIDAGGTWIKAARFDDELEMEAPYRHRSGASTGASAYFQSVAEAVAECETGEVQAIGIAIPGTLDPERQRLLFAANITDLNEVDTEPLDMIKVLKAAGVTLPTVFENDANCAALAEWQRGRGRGEIATRLLHVTWGTGIGTGFVTDGKVQYGWEGGHIPLTFAFEPTAENLSHESLEWHAGVAHLVRRAEALLATGQYETALQPEHFVDRSETSKTLNRLAQEGDALSLQIIDNALAALAQGLHAMALICYPTIVTIGGAMMSNDWLLDRLREHVAQRTIGIRRTSLRSNMIERGNLGNDAGMIGAAILAQQLISS